MPLAGEILTASVLSIGIPAGTSPVTTSSNGSPTTGTTEVFDTMLGYYAPTLINGHRYQLFVNGLIGNGSVANDTYLINARDSGNASNPTASSTLIAQAQWDVPAVGGAGRDSIPLTLSFVASGSGVHTIGVSAQRISGTGVFTPVGLREMYVVDLGGN